jgi:hypothetical protein
LASNASVSSAWFSLGVIDPAGTGEGLYWRKSFLLKLLLKGAKKVLSLGWVFK